MNVCERLALGVVVGLLVAVGVPSFIFWAVLNEPFDWLKRRR